MISQSESGLEGYLKLGLLLSLVVHVLLALILNAPGRSLPAQNLPLVFSVVFEEPVAKPLPADKRIENQIVSPPQKTEDVASTDPKQKGFLSDFDSSTKKEQIRRGVDPRAGQSLGGGKSAAAAQREQKPSKALAAKSKTDGQKPLKHLALDSKTLLENFANDKARAPVSSLDDLVQQGQTQSTTGVSASYRAFSRPMGSGAAILGAQGTLDHLPNLPDGDITLLNTKASLHAVFVRRVASLVFGELRAQGWDSLRPQDIYAVSNSSTVRAVLSPQGKLLRATLESGSGSPRFDEVLEAAVKKGARDSNPPKEAVATDGNFHFIFQARSWSRPAASPRTGAPTERRWLLLSTGLE